MIMNPATEQPAIVTSPLDPSTWTRECAAQHFGPWLIEPEWFSRAVAAVKDGTYRARADLPPQDDSKEDPEQKSGYVVHGGLAVICIAGPIMKAKGKFGGTSSVQTRAAIRKAAGDDSVQSILLHIDSPGGSVAGTFELAKDIARIDRAPASEGGKPVYAHIEDIGASGGYLLASQARRITADTTSYIGSIGVVTTLVDQSEALKKEGLKVHTISTGGMKGEGRDGKVTEEMKSEAQKMVDEIGEHFVTAVSTGRHMSMERAQSLADGRVHIAAEAQKLGLIDGVASIDDAVGEIRRQITATAIVIPPFGSRMAIEGIAAIESISIGQMNSAEATAVATAIYEPTSAISSPLYSEVVLTKESPAMAETSTNSAPVAQPSAAAITGSPQTTTSPQQSRLDSLRELTAQGHFDQGHAAGVAKGQQMELDRMRSIIAACPGKPEMAVAAFIAKQNADSVRIAFDSTVRAEEEAGRVAMEKDGEIARLTALLATGGTSAIPTHISMSEADSQIDPRVQAENEWDRKPEMRRGFTTKERYVAVRSRELSGELKVQRR